MIAKYDKIGLNYNSTRKADKYLSQRIIYFLNPKVDGLYLDIGCGIGNYTIALQDKGLRINISIDKLRKHITSLKIKEVINSFENNLGGYLFVTAEKVS